MTTKRRKAYPLNTGSWSGCYESWDADPKTTDSKLFAAVNCVFRNMQAKRSAYIRPGFANLGQLGSGGNRTPQCIYQHTRLDGTEDPFVFVGGKMYRWNSDITSPVFTDITPGAVTISTSARIFCTTFANLLIVTDGVNRPWTYDHATTTATYIQFDTAAHTWSTYGPPVIYGAKLFFILNVVNAVSRRNEIAWSEEADPATGYFQDTFDNLWELTQTDADPLFCLCATNTALYYFRGDSIGAVQGLVNSDFKTTAVQDATSTTVGSTNPASVIQAGQYIWWADRLGRPHRMPVGGAVEEVWTQMQDSTDQSIAASSVSITQLERWCSAGYNVELGVVVMALWSSTVNRPATTFYTFDAQSGAFAGTWFVNGQEISAFGLLRDTTKRQILMLGSTDIPGGVLADGYLLAQRLFNAGGTPYYKDGNGNFPQITASVQTRQLNDDVSEEWIFDRVDVEFAGDDAGRSSFAARVDYRTSRTSPAGQTVTVPASNIGTQHVSVGIMGRGRFIGVTSNITTTTTTPVPAGFNRVQVTAYPDASDPGIP